MRRHVGQRNTFTSIPASLPCVGLASAYLPHGDYDMLSLPQPLQLGLAHALFRPVDTRPRGSFLIIWGE